MAESIGNASAAESSQKRPREVTPEADSGSKRAREVSPEAALKTTSAPEPDLVAVCFDKVVAANPSYNSSKHVEPVVSKMGLKPKLPVMPPSLKLITGVEPDLSARGGFIGQKEVGIIGYAGVQGKKGVKGVIKQRLVIMMARGRWRRLTRGMSSRFTDFLVNEVLPNGEILRLKDMSLPVEPKAEEPKIEAEKKETKVEIAEKVPAASSEEVNSKKGESSSIPEVEKAAEAQEVQKTDATVKETASESDGDLPESLRFDPLPQWPRSTTISLREHFSDEAVLALHNLFVEGRNPPPKQDGGWGARRAPAQTEEEMALNAAPAWSGGASTGRGQGRDRGR
ncbi:hypothetical protein P7C73_g1810, partial [Tremellales sp. Uapishka_1]